MERSNLQLRHIESFAEHVYAYDDSRLSLLKQCARALQVPLWHGAVEHHGVVLPQCLIYAENLSSSGSRRDACHSNMPPSVIRLDLLYYFAGDIDIRFDLVKCINRSKADRPEVPFSLRKPEWVHEDDLAVEGSTVFAEGSCSELEYASVARSEVRLELLPSGRFCVVSLIDKQL